MSIISSVSISRLSNYQHTRSAASDCICSHVWRRVMYIKLCNYLRSPNRVHLIHVQWAISLSFTFCQYVEVPRRRKHLIHRRLLQRNISERTKHGQSSVLCCFSMNWSWDSSVLIKYLWARARRVDCGAGCVYAISLASSQLSPNKTKGLTDELELTEPKLWLTIIALPLPLPRWPLWDNIAAVCVFLSRVIYLSLAFAQVGGTRWADNDMYARRMHVLFYALKCK